jgi:adenylate cyclase
MIPRGTKARAELPVGRHRRNLVAVAVVLALAGFHAVFGELPWLQNLESETARWRYLVRGTIDPGAEIVLVEIDEASVAALGRWPVPRDRLADVVAWLDSAGASSVVLDLLFLERQSPYGPGTLHQLQSLAKRLETQNSEATRIIEGLLESARPDRDFRRAIAESGKVVLPFAFGFSAEPGTPATPHALRRNAFRNYVISPGERADGRPRPLSLRAPPEELAQAAAGLGHVNVVLDADGALRHALPVLSYREDHYPALSVEALRVHLGLTRDDLRLRFGQSLDFGGLKVPLGPDNRIAVNYLGGAGSFPRHSLAAILAGEAARESFAGRIVLIGGAAAGTGETFATPFTQNLSSVEFHATVIDNMLHGRTMVRGDETQAVTLAALLIGGLSAGLIGGALSMGGALALGLILVLGYVGLSAIVFIQAQWMLGIVAPTVTVLLALTWARAACAVDERARRRHYERERRNLTRYFSPQIADALAARDEPFSLDRKQLAAVMFVDIRGFTTRAEQSSPEDAIALLRRFHGLVEEIVFDEGGTLDKYLGDGAMATFGVPEPRDDDAMAALRAAHRIARRVAAEMEGEMLSLGIGLHHGQVVMGDVGGGRRLEFTVVGDTVNVASRLEALSKDLKATIVASDPLVQRARAEVESASNRTPATQRDDRAILDALVSAPNQSLRGRRESLSLWTLD